MNQDEQIEFSCIVDVGNGLVGKKPADLNLYWFVFELVCLFDIEYETEAK